MTEYDALLDALRAALAPPPVEPDASEIGHLHQALAVSAGGGGLRWRFARRSASFGLVHRVRWSAAATSARRYALAVGAVLLACASGAGAAAVATDSYLGPLRGVAYDLGLPVSSPALAATRGAMATLEQALGSRDPAEVRAAAQELQSDLSGLDDQDRQQVEPLADRLLGAAASFLALQGGTQAVPGRAAPGTGGGSGGVPPATAPPATDDGTTGSAGGDDSSAPAGAAISGDAGSVSQLPAEQPSPGGDGGLTDGSSTTVAGAPSGTVASSTATTSAPSEKSTSTDGATADGGDG